MKKINPGYQLNTEHLTDDDHYRQMRNQITLALLKVVLDYLDWKTTELFNQTKSIEQSLQPKIPEKEPVAHNKNMVNLSSYIFTPSDHCWVLGLK